MTSWKDHVPEPFVDQEFLCVLFDEEPYRLLQKHYYGGFNREVYTGYYDNNLQMFVGNYPHASGEPFPFVVACRPVVEGYDPDDWGEIYYSRVLGELVPKGGRAYNESKEKFERRVKNDFS